MNTHTIYINGKFNNQIQITGPYKFTHINCPLFWVKYTDDNYCIIVDTSEAQKIITYYNAYVETVYKPENIISETNIENLIKNCAKCENSIKNCGSGKGRLIGNSIVIKNCVFCKNVVKTCVTCRELVDFLNYESMSMSIE
jgi:hypothetical protein